MRRFFGRLFGLQRRNREVSRQLAMWEALAHREAQRCDICSGRAVYVCPICREPVSHTHENDYMCRSHSFVNPIRLSDGATISGDGWPHAPRVVA
jgi:hypothetical protein